MATRNDAHALLRKPPVKWGRALPRTEEDRTALSSNLAEIATRAVYLAVYAGSPLRHRDAVRAAQKAVTAARKAMRFSYPGSHPLSAIEIEAPEVSK